MSAPAAMTFAAVELMLIVTDAWRPPSLTTDPLLPPAAPLWAA
jgi:hypothetical protein